jgi:hypothetical protein
MDREDVKVLRIKRKAPSGDSAGKVIRDENVAATGKIAKARAPGTTPRASCTPVQEDDHSAGWRRDLLTLAGNLLRSVVNSRLSF